MTCGAQPGADHVRRVADGMRTVLAAARAGTRG